MDKRTKEIDWIMRNHETKWLAVTWAYDAGVAAGADTERERIAREFDRRDTGNGFYEPHEPAEIVRALGPNAAQPNRATDQPTEPA